jgi:hypothetical protein
MDGEEEEEEEEEKERRASMHLSATSRPSRRTCCMSADRAELAKTSFCGAATKAWATKKDMKLQRRGPASRASSTALVGAGLLPAARLLL